MSRVIVYGGARDGRLVGGFALTGPRSEMPNPHAFNDEGARARAEAEAKRDRKRRARIGDR